MARSKAWPLALTAVTGAVLNAAVAGAADYTAKQLTEALFRAGEEQSIDLSGKSLRELDLAGVDFKGANMRRADL